MRGSLSETSVADLCRHLADAGATGTLEVDHPAGRGRLAFVNGRLAWAEPPTAQARLGDRLVHAGLLSRPGLEAALEAQAGPGEARRLGQVLVDRGLVAPDTIRVYVQEQILDALVELSMRSEGAYEFSVAAAPEKDLPADLLVGDALAIVTRRQEEWERIRATIPGPDAVPHALDSVAIDSAHLEPDDLAVLGVLNGRRSIRQLAAMLGYGTFEAARILYGLVIQGLVEARPAEPAPAPPPDDMDDAAFAQLLEELAEDAMTQAPSKGGTASGTTEEPSEEPAVATEDPSEPPPGSEPDTAEPAAAEPEERPAQEPRTASTRGRTGDVSEFLRELSQLAIDEPDG